jgi:hypothetical protein
MGAESILPRYGLALMSVPETYYFSIPTNHTMIETHAFIDAGRG